MEKYVIGVDFGTDSVRALVVRADSGEEVGQSVCHYPRWAGGLYCDPSAKRFRQHPLDYVEGLERSVRAALAEAPAGVAAQVAGIAIDTTGSTPVAVDRAGRPLALLPAFCEDPDAMFILWKDHTAIREAAEINALAARWETDYTRYEGGIYSSEWFWAKLWHVLRRNEAVREAAYSWVEHCDWIPFLLTGGSDVRQMKRSRCAAGHKALWHAHFGGLPPNDFFKALDPLLDGLTERLYRETHTAEVPAGHLSAEWAEKLGLRTDVVVAVGAFDAHIGAVGGQIEPYHLSKVIGTSTCDILIAPPGEGPEKLVRGICGQVDGSVVPGMLGLEAGQSAFGDVYAWFRDLLGWTLDEAIGKSPWLDAGQKEKILEEAYGRILPALSAAAEQIPPGETGILALDWLNGRRTPDANQALQGALFGLSLGSDAPRIFRALVEATCFGSRAIVERFREEGVPIRGVIALGGIARKSPFVLQTMADVLGLPIRVARSEQTCALGAAMFAATAAGLYPEVLAAARAMGSGFDRTYTPDPTRAEVYERLFRQYLALGAFAESLAQKTEAE